MSWKDACSAENSDVTYERLSAVAEKFEGSRIRVAPSRRFLCFRCTNAMILRAETWAEARVHCTAFEREVPGNVVECNRFQAEGTLSLWQLFQIAKVIEIEGEKEVGFKGVKRRGERE